MERRLTDYRPNIAANEDLLHQVHSEADAEEWEYSWIIGIPAATAIIGAGLYIANHWAEAEQTLRVFFQK